MVVLVGGAPLAARARGAKFLGIQQGSTACADLYLLVEDVTV